MQDYSQLYINGQWVSSTGEQTFDVINPATENVCANVVMGTKEDVDAAVIAASAAFKTWSKTSSDYRAGMIQKLADKLREYRDELALSMSISMGMPLHMTGDVQVDDQIDILETYVSRTKLMDDIKTIGNAQILKQPIGVCALISPWNYPLNQLVGKMAPALAAGCTMIVKPSEQTSLQDFIVAKACDDIGLPKGVFNLVPGTGPEVGAALSSHPDIQLISFTGSTRAGIHIAQNAAQNVKRVVQELGGKSPLIIDKGCDIDAAVQYGIDDVLINTGQTCTAYSRWLVHTDIVKEVIALAKQKAEAVVIGNGPDAFMGPMVSKAQQQRVLNYIERGIKEGAILVTGGLEKPAGIDKGFYVSPTIFANVSNDMVIAREEIFGPVICIIEYNELAEGIAIANDTVYGLAASVFAKDKTLGFDIAKQMDAGMVYVNGGSYNIEAPFGGMKQSGNGREFGDEGLHEYVELKAIHMDE
ncbi:aldehyde dehydrogenase family protein [Pseudomonas sp. HK3]